MAGWPYPPERTLVGSLGIVFLELGPERMVGNMPITERTIQPFGVAHGGALIALAETLASVGTALNIDLATHIAVGQEINASLLRPVPIGGTVTGEALVLHRGRTSMVWDVRIRNDEGKLAVVCRCTIAIRPRPRDGEG
ncbi:MAG TPA: hotdog fold thioesterase [Chloroflexota bacterium]|nr:hotdog fold thioesterase [Chloroflexota bacterium]